MKGVPKDAQGRGNESTSRAQDATRRGDDTRAREMRGRPAAQPPAPRRPKWPIPLALLGLLGIALAAILGSANRSRSELPTDFNTTRQFSGTANSLLNPQAVQDGQFGNALMTNVPVTGQQSVRVLDTNGSNARVLDERNLMSGGTQIGSTSQTFAVNRDSMEPASNPPADWNAEQAQGLTVAFPAGAEKRDYTGWVADTQTTTPLRFLREESRGGVNTFVYQAEVTPTPIRDQTVLGSLPSNLSRAALAGLAPSLPISAEQRATLLQAIPGLPEPVAVNYTFQGSTTYWVEPTTGFVVDTQRNVIRNGAISGPGGSTLANLPVFNVNTSFTDDSVAAAGREAADRRDTLNASGRVWPWVLGTLGALALLAGLLGLLARRRPAAAPATYKPTDRPQTGARGAQVRSAEDVTRKPQSEAGRPQAPYEGTTPHTGPYRESTAGQPPTGGSAGGSDDEQFPSGNQPGQPPGGQQPPKR